MVKKNKEFFLIMLLIISILLFPFAISSESDLIAFYNFNEGNGSILHDITGHLHDGTIIGGLYTVGALGSGIKFDGNDMITLPRNDPVWLPTDNFAVSSWVKFSDEPADIEYIVDLEHSESEVVDMRSGIGIFRDVSGYINFEVAKNNHVDALLIGSNQKLNKDVWYHVAGVRDGKHFHLYLNGVLINSTDLDFSSVDYEADTYDDDSVSIGFFERQGYGPGYFMKGIIDEVKIYNKPLTEKEILKEYNSLACSVNNSIMKIQSSYNSHGALWNYSGSYGICQSNNDAQCPANFVREYLLSDGNGCQEESYTDANENKWEVKEINILGVRSEVLYNQSVYASQITCRLFGSQPSSCAVCKNVISEVKVCTPNHEIVDHTKGCMFYLSSTYNSHASLTQSALYKTPICFGEQLQCRAIKSGACSADEDTLLSLSNETNAHIANGNYPYYPVKICCKSSVISTGNMKWQNMKQEAFPSIGSKIIGKVQVDDTVRLLAEGLTPGKSVNFYVKEDVGFWDSLIDFGKDRQVKILPAVVGADGKASAIWQIKDLDFDIDNVCGDKVPFYFRVEDSGAFSNEKSDKLVVEKCSFDNSKPSLEITTPLCGDQLYKGDSIDVKVSLVDEDDSISGNFNFGDSSFIEINNSNGDITKNHQFNLAGNLKLVANATSRNGALISDSVNIMVIDKGTGLVPINKVYVAACVKSPDNLANIDESEIFFDASNTKSYRFIRNGAVMNLNPVNLIDLKFNWGFGKFDDSNKLEYANCNFTGTFSGTESWSGICRTKDSKDQWVQFNLNNKPSGYKFNWTYPSAGKNWAKLTVSYDGP
ncbi:MAG: LamG domain-containing protein [Nanoarchaeota archaeon]